MRYPIRLQILVTLTTTLVATIVATSVASAVLNARRAERQIEHQLERIIAVVQGSAYPLTKSTLQQMTGLSGAEFVLTDRAGREFAASRDFVNTQGLRAAPTTTSKGLGYRLSIDGQPYFHRAVSVFRAGGPEALVLHVLYPESTSQAARREAIYPAIIAGAFGTGLALLLSAILSRRIARPTVALAGRMSHLSEHGYPQMQVPGRDDEIRDLVLSANGLSSRIAELTSTIRRTERLAVLGQLGGGIAHQLRNAAAGARLAVQLHDRTCRDEDRDCLRNALRQLDLIEEQVACLLSVGKPASGEISHFDLNELISDVARLVGPTCRHRGIALRTVSASEPLLVDGDRSQLRQLVLNLTLNAVEAANSEVRLEPFADTAAEQAGVRVVDDGPGVDITIAPHLFEPFVTTKPEGIGLGLTVAQQVAEAHQGRLSYERSADATTFVLRLPVERQAEQTVAASTDLRLSL